MNFKKSLLSGILALVLIVPGFATSITYDDAPSSSKAFTEIKKIVQKIDFNIEELNNQTVKVHFMINTANEVVVLRTDSDEIDQLIKFNLNYKALENRDLDVNKVYILPISFQTENINT